MNAIDSFAAFVAQLREFIHHSANVPVSDGGNSEIQFNRLALDLFALQFENVPAYRTVCASRKIFPGSIQHWNQIPVIPTSAFKEFDLSSIAPGERTNIFHSSGTTQQMPSRHIHNVESLAIYEASLLPSFKKHFLADWDAVCEGQDFGSDKIASIILTPSPALAPNSSLVHMFEIVRQHFGSRDSLFVGNLDGEGTWTIDLDQTIFALRKSMCANRPIALLGTAFSFVHLLDNFAANNMRYRLAVGSRVLETGGYKGRSRELPKKELHTLITKHLGVPASHIVCEYGMSELSSQAYDIEVQSPKSKVECQRAFRFPPWARSQVISPETGDEVSEGETGLIRVFDLANVRSVMAIQTEDLAIRRSDGFELLGRAAHVEPRGCSLMTN